MATNQPTNAAAAYKAHLREISTLLLNAANRVDTNAHTANDRKITWVEVGTAALAREAAVQLAFAVGTITRDEAQAKHGVTL